jgi:hypothetical protein
MKIQVTITTINVLSHKSPIQAKTRPPLEDWFKSELPVHLLYLGGGCKKAISSTNRQMESTLIMHVCHIRNYTHL